MCIQRQATQCLLNGPLGADLEDKLASWEKREGTHVNPCYVNKKL